MTAQARSCVGFLDQVRVYSVLRMYSSNSRPLSIGSWKAHNIHRMHVQAIDDQRPSSRAMADLVLELPIREGNCQAEEAHSRSLFTR
jgi:hypothetical protein